MEVQRGSLKISLKTLNHVLVSVLFPLKNSTALQELQVWGG